MSHASIARGLHHALTPNWNVTGPWQFGEVYAVAAHGAGTVDLYLDGSSVVTNAVPHLADYGPQVGDAVMVARMQGMQQSARVVLGTVGAAPSKPVFAGYASNSQSVTAATFTTVLVNTVQVDTAGGLAPASGDWTVPLAGVYRVSGITEVATVADTFAVIMHGSAQVARGNRTEGQAVTSASVTTALMNCAAGDTISLQVYSAVANTTVIDGAGQTNRLDIEFVCPA